MKLIHPSRAIALSPQTGFESPKEIQEFSVRPIIFRVGRTLKTMHASLLVPKVGHDIGLQELDKQKKPVDLLNGGIGGPHKPLQLIDIRDQHPMLAINQRFTRRKIFIPEQQRYLLGFVTLSRKETAEI
ncbi:MAG: hypothetical protein ABSH48_25180 [Verrucomicrobiota bacterium]